MLKAGYFSNVMRENSKNVKGILFLIFRLLLSSTVFIAVLTFVRLCMLPLVTLHDIIAFIVPCAPYGSTSLFHPSHLSIHACIS